MQFALLPQRSKALVNKGDANIKYMSAVSDMNAPQVFGDFTC